MKTSFSNGFMFWEEREIKLRNLIADDIISEMRKAAKEINNKWEIHRIEAPILIPQIFINEDYSETDVFLTNDSFSINKKDNIKSTLALRPETTITSYMWAIDLLEKNPKTILPFAIVQLGLSFRKEQDKSLKHMRLKSFYQLEFQFLYSSDSKADYLSHFRNAAEKAIKPWYSQIKRETSDRLPSYLVSTEDIITTDDNPMELASMSDRTDFPIDNIRNVEIAIGIDRLLYKFLNQDNL